MLPSQVVEEEVVAMVCVHLEDNKYGEALAKWCSIVIYGDFM